MRVKNDANQVADVPLTEQTIPMFAALPEMEWRTSVLRLLLRAQSRADETTEIIADTQQVLNRDVLIRLERIKEIFEAADSFFHALGKIGDFAVRAGRIAVAVLELVGRVAKPVFWIAAIVAATWAWWKTGSWGMPDWWNRFIR